MPTQNIVGGHMKVKNRSFKPIAVDAKKIIALSEVNVERIEPAHVFRVGDRDFDSAYVFFNDKHAAVVLGDYYKDALEIMRKLYSTDMIRDGYAYGLTDECVPVIYGTAVTYVGVSVEGAIARDIGVVIAPMSSPRYDDYVPLSSSVESTLTAIIDLLKKAGVDVYLW